MDYSKYSDHSLRYFLDAHRKTVKQHEREIKKYMEVVNISNERIAKITEEINKRNFKI